MSDEMTYKEYWGEVESLAKSITQETFDDLDPDDQDVTREDNNGDAFQEALWERLNETIDGHQWIIYTAYNWDVLRFSNNNNYAISELGSSGLTPDGQLDTAVLAYGALYADVQEHSSFGEIEEKL